MGKSLIPEGHMKDYRKEREVSDNEKVLTTECKNK